jgi:O-antigen/teichoic acid export membrane protein
MLQPFERRWTEWPRILNVGLLIAGFGLGQGAIFIVQTWLVAKGDFELLSDFGTNYSFAMLAIILIDAGSSTVLARHVAGLLPEQEENSEIWRIFWETSAIRGAIALLIGSTAVAYALFFSSNSFSRLYVLWAIPGSLFWASNPIGLLDGLKLSGLSGITGAISYAACAIGLALAAHAPPEISGAILGGAFSLGYVSTVCAQWAVLRRYGWTPQFQAMSRAGLIRSLGDGLALLFQFLPGQLILRVQIALSNAFLGPESTALFVYVKQIVIAMTMIFGFVLRVDFPALVHRAVYSSFDGLWSILRAQKVAFYCAVALTIGTILLSVIAPLALHDRIAKAADLLFSFAPTILTISVFLMMFQALAALGDYISAARIVALSAAVGAVVSYLLVTTLHIYAFILGEMAFHLVGFALLYLHMRKTHPK